MRDHGLLEEDLVMSDSSVVERTKTATWRSNLAGTIADCTNTALILLVDDKENRMMFVGRTPGPEIAVYLRAVCFRAVEVEIKRYRRGATHERRRTPASRRAAMADFVDMFVARLQARLIDLLGSTIDPLARQEAKDALTRKFDDTEPLEIREGKGRSSQAAADGWAAGGMVALNRG